MDTYITELRPKQAELSPGAFSHFPVEGMSNASDISNQSAFTQPQRPQYK